MTTHRLILDLKPIQTMDDFHHAVETLMSFPSYYGRNKDAFWDCLTGLAPGTALSICGLETLPAGLRQTVNEYIDILITFSQENAGHRILVFER